MTLLEATKTCLQKYVTFSGRASRSEYWWFFLFGILASIVAGVLDTIFFGTTVVETTVTETSVAGNVENDGPLANLLSLALLLPGLAVGWRRMHDTGRSGLFLFFPLIVWFGMIAAIIVSSGVLGLTSGLGLGALTAALGGLSLVILIPAMLLLFCAPLVVLWWLTRPSQPETNQYGPNPHEVQS